MAKKGSSVVNVANTRLSHILLKADGGDKFTGRSVTAVKDKTGTANPFGHDAGTVLGKGDTLMRIRLTGGGFAHRGLDGDTGQLQVTLDDGSTVDTDPVTFVNDTTAPC